MPMSLGGAGIRGRAQYCASLGQKSSNCVHELYSETFPEVPAHKCFEEVNFQVLLFPVSFFQRSLLESWPAPEMSFCLPPSFP